MTLSATDAVALANGGTKALYSLIFNYRPMKAGDALFSPTSVTTKCSTP